MSWFTLHNHSTYSLLDGLSQPDTIAERLIENSFIGGAITDHGNIAGAVAVTKAFKNHCKCSHTKESHTNGKGNCFKKDCTCQEYQNYKLKPILGCEFYLSSKPANVKDPSNRHLTHLCVLAKNLKGWKTLIQAVSESNKNENFYYAKNRLSLDELAKYAAGGDLIAFSGHIGSDMAEVCFKDYNIGYNARSFEEARAALLDREELRKAVLGKASLYRDIFGKDNFYLEDQQIDRDNSPASRVVSQIVTKAGKELGIECVATADSHYARPQDAIDQRVILCSALQKTMRVAEESIGTEDEIGLASFFRSNRYHIPTHQEMADIHDARHILNTLKVADMCEEYSILSAPVLPTFPCPNGLTQVEFFRQLCEEGFRKRLGPRTKDGLVQHPEDKAGKSVSEYRARLEQEFNVFTKVGLEGYFLIVWDYCEYARSQGWLLGEGRGSAAGCLISYLLGITNLDPLPYDLLFERFYNDGRNAPGKVSLPDIDTDVQTSKRDKMIAYVKGKYGEDRVCQMSNFGRLQGKSALTEVLRVHEVFSYQEIKEITKSLPGEAEISDKLQEDFEEYGESSIIRWALENNPKEFEQYCKIDDNGELVGEYARYFAQAIRIEGTLKSRGKHASGLIISNQPLANIVPMVYDKGTNEPIIGYEMHAAEDSGLPKFDILAQSTLDRLWSWEQLMRTGELDDEG